MWQIFIWLSYLFCFMSCVIMVIVVSLRQVQKFKYLGTDKNRIIIGSHLGVCGSAYISCVPWVCLYSIYWKQWSSVSMGGKSTLVALMCAQRVRGQENVVLGKNFMSQVFVFFMSVMIQGTFYWCPACCYTFPKRWASSSLAMRKFPMCQRLSKDFNEILRNVFETCFGQLWIILHS